MGQPTEPPLEPDPFCDAQSTCADASEGRGGFAGAATHLSENFFTIGVLSTYGMPPDVADGEAHARYWNLGHNVASEHVATTRGGHPWIVSFDEGQAQGVGNPYYMPYETSVKMWRVEVSEPDLRFYDAKNAKASHNDVHL